MRITASGRCFQPVAWTCGLSAWLLSASAPGAFTEQRATWLNSTNINGYSASLADIDNDGDLDLLFEGSGTSSQLLFRNNTINAGGTASKTFTNVTSSLWQTPPVSSLWSAAWGDYDGDG